MNHDHEHLTLKHQKRFPSLQLILQALQKSHSLAINLQLLPYLSARKPAQKHFKIASH
jgi:hypothetical protein